MQESRNHSKSTKIDALFRDSSLEKPSTLELGWEGVVVEHRKANAGETREEILDHHFIVLWDVHSSYGERAELRGQFIPYAKHPGTVCLGPPGVLPAVRAFTDSHLQVCTLDPVFVNKIEDEFDTRLLDSLHEQLGIHDRGLRQLLSLLGAESEAGGPHGRLYVDSLAHALAVRFLHLARAKKPQKWSPESALPRHLLRRVLELMKSDPSADLTLSTLAAESGYSRAHFLRMFRAATGKTPHQYLLNLRLDEAERKIRAGSTRFVEIALACGFSSHSHFCKAFHHRLGVTPSQYRRHI